MFYYIEILYISIWTCRTDRRIYTCRTTSGRLKFSSLNIRDRFSSIFNALCMCCKIRCDRKSWKLFGFWGELRACLVASPNTPRLTVAAIVKRLLFGSHFTFWLPQLSFLSFCFMCLSSSVWQSVAECGKCGGAFGRRGCGECDCGVANTGLKPNSL